MKDNKFLFIIVCILIVVVLAFIIRTNKETGVDQPYEIALRNDYADSEIVDPYKAEFDEETIDILLNKIDEIEKQKREEIYKQAEVDKNSIDYSSIKNLKYDIIFLDDDNIPELVVGEDDSYVGVYTIKDGKATIIGEEKEFLLGVDGNQLYEYIPKAGIVYNVSTDYAGLINNYNFKILVNGKFEDLYRQKLYGIHFEDINNNKIPDNDEKHSTEINEYYYGDKKLTEEEYLEYKISAEYENFTGKYNKDDMKIKLEGLKK